MVVGGVIVPIFLVLIFFTCCCLQFTLIDVFILPADTLGHRNTRFLR